MQTVYFVQFQAPGRPSRSATIQQIPRIGESVIFTEDESETIFVVSDIIWIVRPLDDGDAIVTIHLEEVKS
jgi:hypothetical protein